jgi:type I restriction enzyme, R subunit
MRQAIEEGFIMDVLASYTTYKAYFGLIKKVENDPQVPQREAAKALARFLRMHPVNIRQKVEVIVEHFHSFTRHKIGGRAKAMVVTDSRLSAVRYKLAQRRHQGKRATGQVCDRRISNSSCRRKISDRVRSASVAYDVCR